VIAYKTYHSVSFSVKATQSLLPMGFCWRYSPPMKQLIAIDLNKIVEDVKAEGKGRRVLWQDSDSIAFLSSGRKERWDFHIDPADEVTLQLTGVQHLVYRTADGQEQTSDIKAGQILLCPAGVPHSPRLEPDSWFIVFERKRRPGEIDYFKWFCRKCGEKVYETSAEVGDYRADPVGKVYHKFSSDEKLRTCKNCGDIIPVPSSA
jgi:3-hydroxyanthranilate 3,4-dioxygenase